MNELAQRLKGARKESGLSQERLAEAVGVSGHAVYLFERGKNRPALDTLERIAAPAAQPPPPPDAHALLAQIVAAQVRAEERADQRHREMLDVLTALTNEQMQTRAEAARTSARLTQIEEALRALLETPEGGCQGQARCTG